MQKAFVAYLLAVIALLPSVDVVYCPDGCGDDARACTAWQADVVSSHADCGLCLNGVAISQRPLDVPTVRCHRSIDPFVPSSFVSSARSALERPPRPA